ncbi:MAG: hypothetical protein QGH82_03510, partial [Candidatus Woesearchaeota archaeon]|nr:hypothetical protein [Candidatus Woesearchaeota archaeon]
MNRPSAILNHNPVKEEFVPIVVRDLAEEDVPDDVRGQLYLEHLSQTYALHEHAGQHRLEGFEAQVNPSLIAEDGHTHIAASEAPSSSTCPPCSPSSGIFGSKLPPVLQAALTQKVGCSFPPVLPAQEESACRRCIFSHPRNEPCPTTFPRPCSSQPMVPTDTK